MKKRNGFTTIELVISITLTLIILGFIMEVLFVLKELFVSTGAKTELLIRQAMISHKLNYDLDNEIISNIANCGNECIEITFLNGKTKELSIDRTKKIIKYGEYVTKLIDKSEFGVPEVSTELIADVFGEGNNSFLQIKIPITYPLYKDEDFGINAIYQYDSRITPINDFDF